MRSVDHDFGIYMEDRREIKDVQMALKFSGKNKKRLEDKAFDGTNEEVCVQFSNWPSRF